MSSRNINFSNFQTGSDGGMFSIGKKFITTYWMYIAVVVLFIAVAIYYYTSISGKSFSANNEQALEGTNQTASKEAELMLFFVDWCPHCKTAKPAWNDVKSEYENKTINGYKVIFTEINCTQETAEVEQAMNKYNIEGFPTIKLLKDGQVIEYDAKPTKDTLTQFLNTVL